MLNKFVYYIVSNIVLGDYSEVKVKISQVDSDDLPYDFQIIAENLYVPWAIAISEDSRLYFTERSGNIRVIQNGEVLPQPLITIEAPFVSRGEGGLMGIALDPDYLSNHYLYVMHTYVEGNRLYNRLIRLLESDNKAQIDKVLIDSIPGGRIHDGGRIKIGPDQKIYITTGDAGNAMLAQDLSSTAGKILRINLDGSIPDDNPFPNSPIYSYGHRNPEGIAWNQNGVLYASEHGQTAKDEINIIKPGANYGWPLVQGEEEFSGMVLEKPLINSGNNTWAPAGITFVKQGTWRGKLLAATLRGEQLLVFTLDREGTRVISVEAYLWKEYGRLREVIEAEDGSIYLTTSNRDGRGTVDETDDKIIRLIPRI